MSIAAQRLQSYQVQIAELEKKGMTDCMAYRGLMGFALHYAAFLIGAGEY